MSPRDSKTASQLPRRSRQTLATPTCTVGALADTRSLGRSLCRLPMRCAWLMLQCREIFGNDCNYVIVSFLGNRVCFYETMFSTKTEVDARDQCVKWMITPPHSFCLTSLSYTFVLQGSFVLKQKKWGGVRRSPWKRKEDRRSILLYIFLLQTLSKKKKTR